jgi:hypothetical protein
VSFRTDRNNNPTAFTTDIAHSANLVLGVDYTEGESFESNGVIFHTAKLLKDPIQTTIDVINKIGFRTLTNKGRWNYINMPKFVWDGLLDEEKKKVIHDMYHFEGGTQLEKLFV